MNGRIAISLLDWLRTGFFGPLRFGQTRAAIETLLGPPDDVGGNSRKYRRPSIWKYGDFELYFSRDSDALTAIRSDTFATPQGGEAMRIDPWELRDGPPRSALEGALAAEGIAYRIAGGQYQTDLVRIITASGVYLDFESETPGSQDYMLSALGQSARTFAG